MPQDHSFDSIRVSKPAPCSHPLTYVSNLICCLIPETVPEHLINLVAIGTRHSDLLQSTINTQPGCCPLEPNHKQAMLPWLLPANKTAAFLGRCRIPPTATLARNFPLARQVSSNWAAVRVFSYLLPFLPHLLPHYHSLPQGSPTNNKSLTLLIPS